MVKWLTVGCQIAVRVYLTPNSTYLQTSEEDLYKYYAPSLVQQRPVPRSFFIILKLFSLLLGNIDLQVLNIIKINPVEHHFTPTIRKCLNHRSHSTRIFCTKFLLFTCFGDMQYEAPEGARLLSFFKTFQFLLKLNIGNNRLVVLTIYVFIKQ